VFIEVKGEGLTTAGGCIIFSHCAISFTGIYIFIAGLEFTPSYVRAQSTKQIDSEALFSPDEFISHHAATRLGDTK